MHLNRDIIKDLSLVPLRWLILILGDSRLIHFNKSQPGVWLGLPPSPAPTLLTLTAHETQQLVMIKPNHLGSTLKGQLNQNYS